MKFNHNFISGRAEVVAPKKIVNNNYEVNCIVFGYAGQTNLIFTFPVSRTALDDTLPDKGQFMFTGHLTENDLGYPAVKITDIVAVEEIIIKDGKEERVFNTEDGYVKLEDVKTLLEITVIPLRSENLVTRNPLKNPLCKVHFDPLPYSHPTGRLSIISRQKTYDERMRPYENHEHVRVNLLCNLMVDQYAKTSGYQDRLSFIVYKVESF